MRRKEIEYWLDNGQLSQAELLGGADPRDLELFTAHQRAVLSNPLYTPDEVDIQDGMKELWWRKEAAGKF